MTSCAGVRNRLCVCYVILGSQRLVEIQVPARQQNIIFICGFCALRKAVLVFEIWGPPPQKENELGTGACCFGMELASASARIYELDEFDARHGLFARARNLCNDPPPPPHPTPHANFHKGFVAQWEHIWRVSWCERRVWGSIPREFHLLMSISFQGKVRGRLQGNTCRNCWALHGRHICNY